MKTATQELEVKLGDQTQKEMTVLFSDIRSFTRLSEKMTPQENFNFINAYFKRVGPIVRKNGGFIDKYIGDAIMALFPASADDAIHAALAMLEPRPLPARERPAPLVLQSWSQSQPLVGRAQDLRG
jgi:class 3 adenylate cyclase